MLLLLPAILVVPMAEPTVGYSTSSQQQNTAELLPNTQPPRYLTSHMIHSINSKTNSTALYRQKKVLTDFYWFRSCTQLCAEVTVEKYFPPRKMHVEHPFPTPLYVAHV